MNMNKITVTVAMSIYKPNLKWFKEQLKSINKQTYRNLEVYIYNDYPNDKFNYKLFIEKYLENYSFKYFQGIKNLGSNKAFEFLTSIINSDYIAYCDQDDIWLPDKIYCLVNEAEKNKADLLCSDMYVIDKDDNIIANKISDIRPHQKFYYGKNVFKFLTLHNFVTGCTVLIRTNYAKKAMPFSNIYYHDWWLALNVSLYGKIIIFNEPLIKYRIHDTNQSEFLKGISTKSDYYKLWINLFENRILELYKLPISMEEKQYIDRLHEFALARKQYFKNFSIKNFIKLIKLRKINKKTTYFELTLPFLPECFFKLIIKQIKKGKI